MNIDPVLDRNVVDLEGLKRLAEEVVVTAKRGAVVWLSGDLGSGKTAFVKEAVRAAGVSGASSPTYAFVNEYESPNGAIFHVDCYRIVDPADTIDLDFPELLRNSEMLFIEWPERAGDRAPEPDIHLRFAHVGDADLRLVERVQ